MSSLAGGMVKRQTIQTLEKSTTKVCTHFSLLSLTISLLLVSKPLSASSPTSGFLEILLNRYPAKTKSHAATTLPSLVENLVKNWEIEASFKTSIDDWRTIDRPNYTFSINGGAPQSAEHMLKVGTYNAIIAANDFYSPEKSNFASSHKTFKRMMPTFAWEVVEVYSGPPVVSFRWRHWGLMQNDYVGFNEYDSNIT